MSYPGLRGRVVFKTWKGKEFVQKWPRKRGQSKNPKVIASNKWFADVCAMIKYAPASQIANCMIAVKGTGLYPRDLLMSIISSGWTDLLTPTGEVISYRKDTLEDAVFQGARVELASPVVTSAGNWFVPAWSLPVMDTAGFWSAGTPEVFTIPAGVAVINVAAAVSNIGGIQTTLSCRIVLNGAAVLARETNEAIGTPGAGCQTGPMKVAAGDTLEMQILTSVDKTIAAGPATYLTLEVLGTV